MSKTKSWFTLERTVIVILLAMLFLLQQCHKSCPKEPWEVVKTKVRTYRDTIITTKIDTITKYVTLKVPVPVPAPDDTTLNLYTQEFKDSTLDVTFVTKVDGLLINSDFKYKLKVPKEIFTTIIQKDTIDKIIKVPKNILAINGILMGSQLNNGFDAGIGLSFYHKKGYLYQANYLPLSKTVIIGFSYQLNRDYD
jgi:hypothetical protein